MNFKTDFSIFLKNDIGILMSKPKMVMRIVIIMGHECIWGTLWGHWQEREGERNSEEDLTHTHKDSIMKPVKHCLKKWGGERE
jgi:hypothetical protein